MVDTVYLCHTLILTLQRSISNFVLLFLFFFLLLQAEVWDLEVLRANNSSWPIDATDLKEGLITVKGYTQVGVRMKH